MLDIQTSEMGAGLSLPESDRFLFKRVGSLAGLVDWWRSRWQLDPADTVAAEMVRVIQSHPELLQPFTAAEEIHHLERVLEQVLTPVFPLALEERLVAAVVPFSFDVIVATQAFEELFLAANPDPDFAPQRAKSLGLRNLFAYNEIMRSCYGLSVLRGVTDMLWTREEGGLRKYYQLQVDKSFMEIEVDGELPDVCIKSWECMDEDVCGLESWLARIDPSLFTFKGFAILEATDITAQESLARLKRLLAGRSSMIDAGCFMKIQGELSNLLQVPRLHLGFGVIGSEEVVMFNPGFQWDSRPGLAHALSFPLSEMTSDTSRRLMEERKPIIIPDLLELENPHQGERGLIERGFRSLLLVPVEQEGELVGIVEFSSPTPNCLNALSLPKLEGLLPLFAVAAVRTKEELGIKVESVMRELFTVIHPSVEWRFRRAAGNYLKERSRNGEAQLEEIVFPDVYPLFGISDIRGSSNSRVEAIAGDLATQLQLADEVLRQAMAVKPLAYLGEVRFRVHSWMDRLDEGIASGDEIEGQDFLQQQIEPILKRIRSFGPEVESAAQDYFRTIDHEMGLIYEARGAYDRSVTRIRQALSGYLIQEQTTAQSFYPHYFEVRKTDGVDHSIYIGASLCEQEPYDPLYLKNLRLWQLMVMCVIARKARELKSELEVPLEVAHLILVQNQPMTIRFQQDEKQFGVDGAYNVRYHLLQKRIDKAMVYPDRSRLTVSGKVVVVYSQPREREEYQAYLDYLRSLDYLDGPVEDLQLADLDGVSGLRALRFGVSDRAGITGHTIERTFAVEKKPVTAGLSRETTKITVPSWGESSILPSD